MSLWRRTSSGRSKEVHYAPTSRCATRMRRRLAAKLASMDLGWRRSSLRCRERYPIGFRLKMPLPGIENVVNEPEFPKPQNNQAIDVDLIPGVRKVGVPRKAMMVVVQAF